MKSGHLLDLGTSLKKRGKCGGINVGVPGGKNIWLVGGA